VTNNKTVSQENQHIQYSTLPVYLDRNLQIIFLVTLMAVLGVASITPAFPKISREFDISANSVSLLIILFTFPAIILTPVLGVVADRYGRKKILVPSLFLFGIAGSLCGFARQFEVLLVLRFFQGIGAASLGSINITLIGDIFSNKKRAEAMGYNSSVLSIAVASYPFIGGILASLKWNYPFFLPVLSIPVAIVVLLRLSNPEPGGKQVLKQYLKDAWRIIKTRAAVTYLLASFITFIILYGSYLIYFPFLLENQFKASPFIIGVMMSCMSLITALTSFHLGKISRIFREKNLLKISFCMYSLALLIIPLVSNIWLLLIPLIIFGFAHGINIPCIQILLAGIAPIEYRAVIMSVNGMVLRIAQTLGPMFMALVFLSGGLNFIFYTGSILSILAFSFLLSMVK
jgi:ACDE family multidrug resistance protein